MLQLQFYFLSVALNVLAGLALVFVGQSEDQESDENELSTPDFLTNRTFRLVLGVLTILVGFFKLFAIAQDDVPVVGALFPAVAGLAGGFALLLDFYMGAASMETQLPPFVNNVFVQGSKYIGIACIVVGILHFVFPKALFL